MVGQYFLSQLAESPLKETHQIVTFCEEIRPAYDRVHLSEFVEVLEDGTVEMIELS